MSHRTKVENENLFSEGTIVVVHGAFFFLFFFSQILSKTRDKRDSPRFSAFFSHLVDSACFIICYGSII